MSGRGARSRRSYINDSGYVGLTLNPHQCSAQKNSFYSKMMGKCFPPLVGSGVCAGCFVVARPARPLCTCVRVLLCYVICYYFCKG